MSSPPSKNQQDFTLSSSRACKLSILDLTNSTFLKTLFIDRLFRTLTYLLPCTFTSTSTSKCTFFTPILIRSGGISDHLTALKSWSYTKKCQISEILPSIRLAHPPNLYFIPLSPTACCSCPCWLISVELVLNSPIHPMTIEAMLVPQLKNKSSSSWWTTTKAQFDLVKDQDYSLALFAFNYQNFLHTISRRTLCIDLYINLICGSREYTLKLLDPLQLDFQSLLTRPYPIVDSLWTKRCDLLPCLFPLTKQWSLQTTSHTIFTILESKLGWNQAVDYRDNDSQSLGRRRWFFTSGILAGTLLDLVSNLDPCFMRLEARSCSLLNLELVESVLQQLPNTHVQPHTPIVKDKTHAKRKSHIEQLRNSLITEIECLMELTTRLITSTMHNQVPKLPSFLKDIGNNLEIAHRLTEWGTLLEGALSAPIENIEPSEEYMKLCLLTDDCVQLLC